MSAEHDPPSIDMSASDETGTPERLVPPIENRFLFVDVAAQRAKQLRRGALPRLAEVRTDGADLPRPERFFRLERVAMEEVNRGLVQYTLPEESKPGKTGTRT